MDNSQRTIARAKIDHENFRWIVDFVTISYRANVFWALEQLDAIELMEDQFILGIAT